MKILVLLAAATPAFGQVAITLQKADFAAIPGSTRSVYADVEGTPNLTVKWKVTGGCTLASPVTTAAPQVVTAPDMGSACTATTKAPTNETPSFDSATSCTITAASEADESKTASIVIPVCAPPVMLSTFPGSTVLYKNQMAVIQSDLRGSVDTGVTWTIATNPGNAGSLIGGASNRHAVFVAKAAGTYLLTATSHADPTKKSSTAIYVTANDLPAPNADHTEPVDCTAVGNGKTYEVGPAREYHDLNDVAWALLKGGDTVRIHNDDTTGSSPTTYHQHIMVPSSGTATQPLRICGVPDAKGVKPIIDGADATSRADADWASGWIEDLGVILLYDPKSRFGTTLNQNRNVLVEGLHIRNASPSFNFMKKDGTGPKPYGHAGCVFVETGIDIMVRGNDLDSCAQGVFSNARTPAGAMVYNLTVEGNYVHDWGIPGNFLVHAMYIQAIGVQIQFNYFGGSTPKAIGNVIKDRSVMNFLRWNYISQLALTARAFDMVEPQAFSCYITPTSFSFAYRGGRSSDCPTPNAGGATDPITPDQIAANYESFFSDYIYGNIMDDTGSEVPFVHYGFDQQVDWGAGTNRRGGTLYYWANTHLSRLKSGAKGIFDPVAPGVGHSYQFPTIESVNNVFGALGKVSYQWTAAFWPQITVDSNWMLPGYSLPSRASADVYQGGNSAAQQHTTCNEWGMCNPENVHLIWARNGKLGTAAASLYLGPTPFDTTTFLPTNAIRGLAAPLPKAIQDQPSNMEYFPATNTIAPRQDPSYLGALD